MSTTPLLHRRSTDGLHDSQWQPVVDAFTHYLAEHGYAPHTAATYMRCLAHFAHWTSQCRLSLSQIDEEVVREFLHEHLPDCHCKRPVSKTPRDLRASLGHLLVVLRANAFIAEHAQSITPVDEELRRFDEYMNHVRGLAAKTRREYLRTVRRLLFEQFGDRPVTISAITPDDVRRFVADQVALYSTAAGAGMMVSALRGYLRFRAADGDPVYALLGVVTYPANWQLASLPKALSSAEIQRLIATLGHDGPSARRSDAIVRCALDLGLRCGEIAKLGLDDIDWLNGTVTLRNTKSRREDVLPLPAATGQAIADYLQFERPPTTHRGVFVRHIAPYDRPIGPDLVRKSIRQAYARAGLPYTRAHLLRHTMADRLLAGGSSLKEVADVLRHRSLNTTLIYAKLDSRNLAAVALPWPGCVA